MIKELLIVGALIGTPLVALDNEDTPVVEEETTTATKFTAETLVGNTFTLTVEDGSYDKLKIENATNYTLEVYLVVLEEDATTTKGEYKFDENLQVVSLYNTDKSDIVAEYKVFADYTMEEYTKGLVNTMTEKIKAFASEYLTEQRVYTIISLVLNSGLLTAIAGVYFKYRKYKATSADAFADAVNKKVDAELQKSFEKQSKEQLEQLTKKLDSVEKALATTQKVVILAQDKTAEGKKAALDLLMEKTDDEEVKKQAEEVKEKVIEEQKVVEEVQAKVKTDYTPID